VKGVDIIRVGTVSSDASIHFGSTRIALDDLRSAHEGWFPALMA
jgi:hypothetical protein